MAYNTTFSLEWQEDQPTEDQVLDQLTVLRDQVYPGTADYDQSFRITKQIVVNQEEDSWYEHHEHMTVLSLRWPNVLFTLKGSGEDREDVWKSFYLAGKSDFIKAQIVFPVFDPSTLRSPSPPPSESLSDQTVHLRNQIKAADPDPYPMEDQAVRILRSLYGHAPDDLSIQYAGCSNITITAGKHPGPNLTIIISNYSQILSYVNSDSRDVATRHPSPGAVTTDTSITKCLELIRSANQG